MKSISYKAEQLSVICLNYNQVMGASLPVEKRPLVPLPH